MAGTGAGLIPELLGPPLLALGSDSVQIKSPHTTAPGSGVTLSPDAAKATFDPATRRNDPSWAARNEYRHPFQTTQSTAYRLGNEIGRPLLLRGAQGWHNLFNQGPGAGAGAGALGGALVGLLGTGAYNIFRGAPLSEGVLRNLLLAGAVGAGAGGYIGRRHTYPLTPNPGRRERRYGPGYLKQAMYKGDDFGSDGKNRILAALRMAPGLSFHQRGQLMAGVSRLSSSEARMLANFLSGAGGAAAGALIAKFLMKRGLVGQVMGAVMGGVLGRAVFGRAAPRNFIGQRAFVGRDFSGNPL